MVTDEGDGMDLATMAEAELLGGKVPTDEGLAALVSACRPVAILCGDWPDGEVARTSVLMLSDGSTWGVDHLRTPWPYGDGDEERLGNPRRMRSVAAERAVVTATWVDA